MIVATHGIVASQILTVPVATAATSVGDSSFTANWNAYSGANYYLLDVSLNSSFSSFVGVYQNYLVYTTSQVVSGLSSNTTYYYRVRAVTGIDTDAAAFINRVYTAGGALSYTEATATEQLVADLKSYSIWSKMKAIYPMVGASSAACAQNLKSSSFTGTFSGGWTYASTGVTPNGSTGYMDTGFIPNTNFSSQNNISFGYYNNGNMTSPSTEMGSANLGFGNGTYLIVNVSNVSYNRVASNSTQVYNASPYTTGLYVLSRIVSTEFKYYKNSSILNTATIASSGLTTNTFWAAGGVNYGGSAEYGGGRCAFSFIGDGLTDTEISNYYTSIQTFQTTLSRQV